MVRLAVANHVPQKETWRITLTWPVINRGREVAFLIEGATKAQVLRRCAAGSVRSGVEAVAVDPAGEREADVLLDAAAAAKLPEPAGGTLELS